MENNARIQPRHPCRSVSTGRWFRPVLLLLAVLLLPILLAVSIAAVLPPLYDNFLLYFLTKCHVWDVPVWTSFGLAVILVLWSSLPPSYKGCPKWFCYAILVPLILMIAYVLTRWHVGDVSIWTGFGLTVVMLLWISFPRRYRGCGRACQNRTLVVLLLITAAFASAYFLYPGRFYRFSPPWLGAAIASVLLVLWLRVFWLALRVLYGAYRLCWRVYLWHDPRAVLYLDLLREMRPLAPGREFFFRRFNGDRDGRFDRWTAGSPPRAPFWGWCFFRIISLPLQCGSWLLQTRLARVLRRLFCGGRRIPWIDHDPFALAEFQQAADRRWREVENELYGSDKLPDLKQEQAERVRTAFLRWLAAMEALAECHLSDLSLESSPESEDSRYEEHWESAASIFAEMANRCLSRTMRRLDAGSLHPGDVFFWFDDNRTASVADDEQRDYAGLKQVAERACDLIDRELACLTRLDEKPAGETGADLLRYLTSARSKAMEVRLRRVRLVSAVIQRHALDEESSRGAGWPEGLWTELNRTVDEAMDEILRQAGNGGRGDRLALLPAARQRFLDACLFSSQYDLIKIHVRWMEDHGGLEPTHPWRRADLKMKAVVEDAQADRAEETFAWHLRNAVAALKAAYDPRLRSYRSYRQVTKGDPRFTDNEWDEFLQLLTPDPDAGSREAGAPSFDWDAAWETSRDVPPLKRKPDYLARIPLNAAGLAVCGLLLLAGLCFQEGPVTEVPDLRTKHGQWNSVVQTIALGKQEDSLWVGTESDGVHIKGPGRNHTWYHADSRHGLASDDVERVHVGDRQVAYLCRKNTGLALCQSSTPRFAPGCLPWYLGLSDWQTIFEPTFFKSISSADVTLMVQEPAWDPETQTGSPILLVGTDRAGLGRYHVGRRRWLPDPQIDEQNGFLPESHGGITDIAVAQRNQVWHAWVGTRNGLAGGPVFDPRDPDRPMSRDDWTDIPGAAQEVIEQVALRDLDSWNLEVAYHVKDGGLKAAVVRNGNVAAARTLVGKDGSPGLQQAGISRVAYAPAGRRIWIADKPAGESGKVRISVYRESSHEWSFPEPWFYDTVHDLAATTVDAEIAYAATSTGVRRLSDSAGPDEENIGPPGRVALRVEPEPGSSVVAVYSTAADGSQPRIERFDGAGQWSTVFGGRRKPGLTADELSAVEPDGGVDRFYLGTKTLGPAYVDTTTRDVYAPFGGATVCDANGKAKAITDLCLAPVADDEAKVRRWLVQVSEDGALDAITADDPDAAADWTSLLDRTSAGLNPNSLAAVAAYGSRLYAASSTAVASYSMTSHGWQDNVTDGEGFRQFFEAWGGLWILGWDAGKSENTARLVASQAGAAEEPPDTEQAGTEIRGFQAIAGHPQNLATIKDGALVLHRAQDGQLTAQPIVQPKPLGPGSDQPQVACVDGPVVYIAPVAGAIGRYDLSTHAWKAISPPAGVAPEAIVQMHVNAAGLWVVQETEASDDLFVNSAQDFPPDGWRTAATGLDEIAWGDDSAVVLFTDGRVQMVFGGDKGPEILVGAPLQQSEDFTRDLTAAVEYDGELFVAFGKQLGIYSLQEHHWETAMLPSGETIEQLVDTDQHLYARDAGNQLYRLSDQGEWICLNPLLAGSRRQTTATFAAQPGECDVSQICVLPAEAGSPSSLGVIVAGIGSYLIRDGRESAPDWITAESQGPKPEGTIVCAGAVDDDLYLGTDDNELWGYRTSAVNGVVLPPMWYREPLPEYLRRDTLQRLLPVPTVAVAGPAINVQQRLCVVGTENAALLERMDDRSWKDAGQLNDQPLLDLTASSTRLYLAEEQGDSGTRLRQLGVDGQRAGDDLVGDACPHLNAATRAVAPEPNTDNIFRADADGKIAWYEMAKRAWTDRSLPETTADKLFTSCGEVWSWSRTTDQLFYWNAGWDAFQEAVEQVVWDSDAIVLRLQDGSLRSIIAGPKVTSLLPSEAERAFPGKVEENAELLQPGTHLAEMGDFLVVSPPGQGTSCYDRAGHRWQQVSPQSIRAIAPDPGQPRGAPRYYVCLENGSMGLLELNNDAPAVRDIVLPNGELGTGLFSRGPATFVVCESGAVYRLAVPPAKVTEELRPIPWQEDRPPPIAAATEWAGHLLLAYADENKQGRIAIYDPDRMVWLTIHVPEGPVARFHTVGDGNNATLFAETGTASVVKVVHRRENDPPWAADQVITRNVQGVAAGDKYLWCIDSEDRVNGYSTVTGQVAIDLSENDELPPAVNNAAVVQSAFSFADELVVLADSQLWHYSLQTLKWSDKTPGGQQLSILTTVDNEHFAVSDDGRRVFHYQVSNPPKWAPLEPGTNGQFDLGQAADAAKASTTRIDQWTTSGTGAKFQLKWKSGATGDGPANVSFQQGRLDFNRYRRMAFRNGQLVLETHAKDSAGRPVLRRFTVNGLRPPAEVDQGDQRFASSRDADPVAEFAVTPAYELDGQSFQLKANTEGGDWPLSDGGRARLTFQKLNLAVVPVVTENKKIVLDMDRWQHLAVIDQDTVIAATPAGLLRLQFPADGKGTVQRSTIYQPAASVSGLTVAGNIVYAKSDPDTEELVKYWTSSDSGATWKQLQDATEAKAAFVDSQPLPASNANLTDWHVAERPDDALGLDLKVPQVDAAPAQFTPVSLGPAGFGFDRIAALQVTGGAIVAYTPDGCVKFGVNAVGAFTLNPVLKLSPGKQPEATVVRAVNQYQLQLVSGKVTHLGLNGIWDDLSQSDEPRGQIQAILDRALCDDPNGWTWNSDETVTAPLLPGQKLSARYVPSAGQFSFDRVRAIQAAGAELWVLTDTEVQTWQNGGLTAIALDNDPLVNRAAEARFVQANGDWYLGVTNPGSGQEMYFVYNNGWSKCDDQDPVRQLVAAADNWLLAGETWRALQAVRSVGEKQDREFALRPQANRDFVIARLHSDGRWDFDQAQAIGGSASKPVVGTAAGLRRIEDVARPKLDTCTLISTATPVERIAGQITPIHVRLENGEEWDYDPQTWNRNKATTPFAEKDRMLLDGETWKWQRTPEGQLAAGLKGSLASVSFLDPSGRFDFDDVLDVETQGQQPLLATRHGFIVRNQDDPHDMKMASGLPQIGLNDSPRLFSLWYSNGVYVFAEVSGVCVQRDAEWQRIPDEHADAVRSLQSNQVAANSFWRISRGGDELHFAVSVPIGDASRRPVTFVPDKGCFSFDRFEDLVLAEIPQTQPLQERILVATQGGVCGFDHDGKLTSLDSDLDGDGQSDVIRRLWAVQDGVLALQRKGAGYLYYVFDGKDWKPVSERDALLMIFETFRTTKDNAKDNDHGAAEWHVDWSGLTLAAVKAMIDEMDKGGVDLYLRSRCPAITRGAAEYDLAWTGQPVALLDEDQLRFAHDHAVSAEWHDDSLWVASRGGVLEYQLDRHDAGLTPAPGPHLWSQDFLAGGGLPLDLYSIRTEDINGAATLCCRSRTGESTSGQRDFTYAIDRTWQETGDPLPAAKLLEQPGKWIWTLLSSTGGVQVDLSSNVFHVPADYERFSNGTLAFWDVPVVENRDQDPLVCNSAGRQWFVATSGGIVGLADDGKSLSRVYAKGPDGKKLGDVACFMTKDTQTFAVAEPGQQRGYRFDQDADQWMPSAMPSSRHVQTAWMNWEFDPAEPGVQVALLPSRSDLVDHRPEPLICPDGRFAFDVIRRFAWYGGHYWLATPIGVIRLDAGPGNTTGDIDHFARDFGPQFNTLDGLGVHGNSLYIAADSAGWCYQPANNTVDHSHWKPAENAAAKIQQRATNPLFTSRAHNGHVTIRFPFPDLAECSWSGNPPILSNGMFLFDDMKDVWLDDDSVCAATPLGVWHYPRDATIQRIPSRVCFRAHQASGRLAYMTDLRTFYGAGEDWQQLAVMSSDGTRLFVRRDDAWETADPEKFCRMPSKRLGDAEREHWHVGPDLDSPSVMSVQLWRGTNPAGSVPWPDSLAQSPPGSGSHLLEAFQTKDSLWLLVNGRVVWVRKDKI